MSLTNHLDTFEQEFIRCILCDMDAETRLQFMQFLLDLQYHVRKVVGGILSVSVHTTYINIGEVIIRTRL